MNNCINRRASEQHQSRQRETQASDYRESEQLISEPVQNCHPASESPAKEWQTIGITEHREDGIVADVQEVLRSDFRPPE